MKLRTFLPYLAISFILPLGACKKSENAAPPKASVTEDTAPKPAPAPPPAEPAPVAAPAAQLPSAPPVETNQLVTTGEPVFLKIKWPVGNRYVYRMDLDQRSTNHVPMMPKPVQQNVSMAITYSLSVTKELPDNGHELQMEFLADAMEVRMGEQVIMSFASKETEKAQENPMVAPLRKMIGSKLQIDMKPDGRVDKVVGLDEWRQSITGHGGRMGGMLSQQFNDEFIRQIVDYGRAFPTNAVRPGDTWPLKMDVPTGPAGKISIEATVAFKGWQEHDQHKCAVLQSMGTFNGTAGQGNGPLANMSIENGTVSSSAWFDPELGALVESSADQSMNLKGEIQVGPAGNNKGPGMAITMDLGQRLSTKLVESGKISP
jgi:hypothetical protein